MKKLFTLLALTLSFSMNAQLTAVTEGGSTGQRLSTSNASNHGDIGSNAVDLSYSNSSSSTRGATGNYSVATGWQTIASGNYSTATGVSTTASGTESTATGWQTTARGIGSTAMGEQTTASGESSTAMGYQSTASGIASTAMGKSTASGTYSTAMGYDTVASGIGSTAMGRSIASDFASTVIGQYNSSGSSATSADSFSTSAPAFVIGNGTAINAKSDAFKVMFIGDTTVSNDLTVSGDVVISSDARLKSNIVSLGSTLPKLLQIDGKSYEMKGKQKIGVLAQEIKEVFPELVSEDDNEMLAVNYQGLVPVLINALKEQQSEIDELKEMVQELASRD